MQRVDNRNYSPRRKSLRITHYSLTIGVASADWTHNDFPYEKFLTSDVDETVLTWRPIRANPPQLNPEVQSKLTATLGKHSIIIPPELNEKLQTDSALRQKVIANIEAIYKFHTQPPPFKMPGVKEYGTKLYGSVTILNAAGDARLKSGGTADALQRHDDLNSSPRRKSLRIIPCAP